MWALQVFVIISIINIIITWAVQIPIIIIIISTISKMDVHICDTSYMYIHNRLLTQSKNYAQNQMKSGYIGLMWNIIMRSKLCSPRREYDLIYSAVTGNFSGKESPWLKVKVRLRRGASELAV